MFLVLNNRFGFKLAHPNSQLVSWPNNKKSSRNKYHERERERERERDSEVGRVRERGRLTPLTMPKSSMSISRLEIFAPPKIRNKKSTSYSIILTLHGRNKNKKEVKQKGFC